MSKEKNFLVPTTQGIRFKLIVCSEYEVSVLNYVANVINFNNATVVKWAQHMQTVAETVASWQ